MGKLRSKLTYAQRHRHHLPLPARRRRHRLCRHPGAAEEQRRRQAVEEGCRDPGQIEQVGEVVAGRSGGAERSTGSTGARGPQGARGDKGEKGVKGDTGERGPTGNLSTNLPRDVTLRGRFDVDAVATAKLQEHGDSISFGDVLAEAPHFQVIEKGGPTSPECPGSVEDPRAGPGYLCLYNEEATNLESIGLATDAFGADVILTAKNVGRYLMRGSWAVTGS